MLQRKKKTNEIQIKAFGISDIGLEREVNEDSYYLCPDNKCFFVCDGMGGHKAGDVASQLAIDIVSGEKVIEKDLTDSQYEPETLYDNFGNEICNLIKIANYGVFVHGYKNKDLKGMGSTFAGLFINNGKIYIANVGDSRVYFISKDSIVQKTKDHSWVVEQLDKKILTKEEALNHPLKNVITRALGLNHDIQVDMTIEDIKQGYFLLCTDGLSNLASDKFIHKTVIENKGKLKKSCKLLVEEAKKNGGNDNITVIIVKSDIIIE